MKRLSLRVQNKNSVELEIDDSRNSAKIIFTRMKNTL